MIENDDWRLTDQDKYLKSVVLRWKRYKKSRQDRDHDHCSFCWGKFMEDDFPEVFHEGYTTENDYHWICKQCFEDFKEMFQWKLQE